MTRPKKSHYFIIKFRHLVATPYIIIIIFAVFLLGAAGGYFYHQQFQSQESAVLGEEKNVYTSFLFEIYDKIENNYWQKIDSAKLVNLYILGIEKLTGQPQNMQENNRANLAKTLNDILAQIEDKQKKKEFTTKLADIVLANLQPFGRSRLYTKQDKENLAQRVENKTEVNHYQALELEKGATQEEINAAHQELAQKWDPVVNEDPDAAEKLVQINQAYEVLKDEESRQVYDVSGVEPTISYYLARPHIFYVHLKKFSPTTMDEFQRVMAKVEGRSGLDTFIFDLRGNVGGAIDGLPYFLGPFIGKDQYAYQFLHQGEKTDYKTKTGWLSSLVQYKKVVILIDEKAQSSAEVMASVLKKYNVGVLVGNTTRGWGTVERVFKIDSQLAENEIYSMFLVHSVTLRADDQPIEGKGVDPHVFVSDANWQSQLYSYIPDDEVVATVANIFEEK